MPIKIETPYVRRSIRFLELWTWRGWQLKVYGISTIGEAVSPELVVIAKNLARDRLPAEATSPKHYGVGFVIIHEGANGDYVFVDWWFDTDVVQHHLYGAPKGHGGKLRYRWPEGAGFCVWELAVCCFEREAWVETVLSRPPSPNLDDYLARRMNEDV